MFSRQLFLAAAITTACLSGAAQANHVECAGCSAPEKTFYDLSAAWVAYERCNDIVFDQAQQYQLNRAIMERVGAQLGAGAKLHLIQSAKLRTSMQVATSGCAVTNSHFVVPKLELFQSALAPVLGL
jgi:hypothetical protein